jgi:hypothetical protein
MNRKLGSASENISIQPRWMDIIHSVSASDEVIPTTRWAKAVNQFN